MRFECSANVEVGCRMGCSQLAIQVQIPDYKGLVLRLGSLANLTCIEIKVLLILHVITINSNQPLDIFTSLTSIMRV